jgi:GWxTD domain-containing protein
MKRIRRLLEPQAPRSIAGPAIAAVLLVAPLAVALSAWPAKPQTLVPAPSPAQVATQPPPPALVAQAPPKQPPTAPLANPYRKWLNEDVAYIITDEERGAFNKLTTDDERENFIEQFWLRRDPTPGTPENEFKEEHYRRIAYANERFSETLNLPGWKSDRGRIYIQYGPPDEIIAGQAPARYPVQQWRYRFIEGVGTNVLVEFVDATGAGEFHMTTDPSENGAGQGKLGQFLRMESLANIDKQIRNMEDQLAMLRAQYQEAHPAVRQIEAELAVLQAKRAEMAILMGNYH